MRRQSLDRGRLPISICNISRALVCKANPLTVGVLVDRLPCGVHAPNSAPLRRSTSQMTYCFDKVVFSLWRHRDAERLDFRGEESCKSLHNNTYVFDTLYSTRIS